MRNYCGRFRWSVWCHRLTPITISRDTLIYSRWNWLTSGRHWHHFIKFSNYLVCIDILYNFEPNLSYFEYGLFFLTMKTFNEFFVFIRVFLFIEEFDETAEDKWNTWWVAAFVVNHIKLLYNCLIRCLYELILSLRYLHLLFIIQQCHYHRIYLIILWSVFTRYLFKILSYIFYCYSGLLVALHQHL